MQNNDTSVGTNSVDTGIAGSSVSPETAPILLTAGEKACGITFNPSNDPLVATLKSLFAQAFDMVEQSVPADDGTVDTARVRKLRDIALGEIITAQMWAVKVVTFKK